MGRHTTLVETTTTTTTTNNRNHSLNKAIINLLKTNANKIRNKFAFIFFPEKILFFLGVFALFCCFFFIIFAVNRTIWGKYSGMICEFGFGVLLCAMNISSFVRIFLFQFSRVHPWCWRVFSVVLQCVFTLHFLAFLTFHYLRPFLRTQFIDKQQQKPISLQTKEDS